MNIAIIGRSEILYDTALYLSKEKHNIRIIITAKEAPEYEVKSTDFKNLAIKLQAKYYHSPSINNDEYITLFKKEKIDIGISYNYVSVIGQKLIDNIPLGILNAHGGDLPKYRGNACQAWAIINGEKRIGLCIHKMQGGELDSGDIISRVYFPLNENTKIIEVHNWMRKRIPELFDIALQKLEKNPGYFFKKQSIKTSDIIRCYPRRPEDGRIDWKNDSSHILRLINASGKPYAGAFCFYKDKKMILHEACLIRDNEYFYAVPGQVSQINNEDGSITVITGSGKLSIKYISLDYYNGPPASIIKSIRNRLT